MWGELKKAETPAENLIDIYKFHDKMNSMTDKLNPKLIP